MRVNHAGWFTLNLAIMLSEAKATMLTLVIIQVSLVPMMMMMRGNHAVLGRDKTCLSERKDHHQYSGGEIRQQGNTDGENWKRKKIGIEQFEPYLKFQSGIMRGKEKKTGAKWVKMELRQKRALRKEAKTLQQIFSFFNRKWILSDMVENWKWLTCLQRSGQFLPLLLFAGRRDIGANGGGGSERSHPWTSEVGGGALLWLM